MRNHRHTSPLQTVVREKRWTVRLDAQKVAAAMSAPCAFAISTGDTTGGLPRRNPS